MHDSPGCRAASVCRPRRRVVRFSSRAATGGRTWSACNFTRGNDRGCGQTGKAANGPRNPVSGHGVVQRLRALPTSLSRSDVAGGTSGKTKTGHSAGRDPLIAVAEIGNVRLPESPCQRRSYVQEDVPARLCARTGLGSDLSLFGERQGLFDVEAQIREDVAALQGRIL